MNQLTASEQQTGRNMDTSKFSLEEAIPKVGATEPNPSAEHPSTTLFAEDLDVIVYMGQISMSGYERVSDLIEQRRASKNVLLCLTTPGGDPHAGFRIARALQHHYDRFDLMVPRYCKSAGTLIAIGAKNLYLANMSELGPLDIQVRKADELVGNNSGLDVLQAVNYLKSNAMEAFRSYMVELTVEAGLSTRTASKFAARLTSGVFQPISAQIDPTKLAEMQRAVEIAFEYGKRLDEKSGILKDNALTKLVLEYPSHGFVIDRKEARDVLFRSVHPPVGVLAQISQAIRSQMTADHVNSHIPLVGFNTINANPASEATGDSDATSTSTEDKNSSTAEFGDSAATQRGDAPSFGDGSADFPEPNQEASTATQLDDATVQGEVN